MAIQRRGICPACFKEFALRSTKTRGEILNWHYGDYTRACEGLGQNHFGTPEGLESAIKILLKKYKTVNGNSYPDYKREEEIKAEWQRIEQWQPREPTIVEVASKKIRMHWEVKSDIRACWTKELHWNPKTLTKNKSLVTCPKCLDYLKNPPPENEDDLFADIPDDKPVIVPEPVPIEETIQAIQEILHDDPWRRNRIASRNNKGNQNDKDEQSERTPGHD